MQVRKKKVPEKDVYTQIAEYLDTLYQLCELNGLYFFPSTGKTESLPGSQYDKEKLTWSHAESFEIYSFLSPESIYYKGKKIREGE